MKVWNTRQALTSGIKEVECDDSTVLKEGRIGYLYGKKNDWHKTKGEAILRALKMIELRKKALIREDKRLDAMAFNFSTRCCCK
jgi:hypothetical protein